MIHKLVKRVKERFVMDVKYGLQEVDARLFFLRVIIIFLELKGRDETLLELIED